VENSAHTILARLEHAADPTNPAGAEETRALSRELDEIEHVARRLLSNDPNLALRLVASVGGPFAVADEAPRGIALTEVVVHPAHRDEPFDRLGVACHRLGELENLGQGHSRQRVFGPGSLTSGHR
jgi:hypothetical protein